MKNVMTKYLFPFLALLIMSGVGNAQQIGKSPAGDKTAVSDSIVKMVIAIEKEQVIKRADNLLKEKPKTVTASSCPRSMGGRHDFYSKGPYWWPNPANPNGPFIRKDGLRFPGRFQNHDEDLRNFSWIVGTHTSAWILTGKEIYAKAAMEH